MKTKQIKTLEEFKKEFQKNIRLTILCKIITIFLFIVLVLILAVFVIDIASFFRPLIGVLFILIFCLIGILAMAKNVQYFGSNGGKIKRKLQKNVEEWRHGINYLGYVSKQMNKEEYEKNYLVKSYERLSVAFDDIPQTIEQYNQNILITEQKIEFLHGQKEKTDWKYIFSWEWLKVI